MKRCIFLLALASLLSTSVFAEKETPQLRCTGGSEVGSNQKPDLPMAEIEDEDESTAVYPQ